MHAWVYERARDFGLSADERARRLPREPAISVWVIRSACQMLMRLVLRICHSFEVVGREHLPPDGSFIMVGNHSSHLDAVCLLAALPLRRVHSAFPVAAADYFFATPLRRMLSVVAVNALPLDRDHHGFDGIEACRKVLETPNNIVIMFPEGTRSCSGALGRFRSGVARLAAGTSTPVVPCYLSGAFEAWPKGRAVPRPLRVRLHIGRPRLFVHLSPDDRDALAAASAQLRNDVAALGPSVLSSRFAT
jgi:1-acyl-sn-glycerol-3-phosphate acyltransferase